MCAFNVGFMRVFSARLGLWLMPAALGAADVGPDFVHEIAPILRESCLECHSNTKKKAGLSFNSEESFREGSEFGEVIDLDDPDDSILLELLESDDDTERMPSKDDPLKAEQIALIRAWIAAGAKWEPGFTFQKPDYKAPLKPRMPELPVALEGRDNPIDRVIDHYLTENKSARPKPLNDATFLRRVHLDLTGLLPTASEVSAFLEDQSTDKRAEKVDALLADQTKYAEHWLSFWNDLLRNDYAGTGYIDGGRKQISNWLYQSLVGNKPYDQFVRELVAPTPESEGFAAGIKWRGSVSAAQTTPMQYAQSVGQVFLGINLKCASCHDSFIDDWKLSDAYGLAAIYADEKLEMSRCDKLTGKIAEPAWLFPEIGKVDSSLARPERLAQLANLVTSPENGRTPRVVVNRIWQRLMGRGIVHPVDSMQSEPWSEDLLDFLGVNLTENGYDLKKTMRLICLSQAYQSESETYQEAPLEVNYTYRGPRAKRLSAEEFTDAIWQICGTAPTKIDAPVQRPAHTPLIALAKSASWLWLNDQAVSAGQQASFRRQFKLIDLPESAHALVSADNEFEMWINGQKVLSGTNWMQPQSVNFTKNLIVGDNEIIVAVRNGGAGDNPAGLVFHALFQQNDKSTQELVSDIEWEVVATAPDAAGNFPPATPAWQVAVALSHNSWNAVTQRMPEMLTAAASPGEMVRAVLLKSDLLMRTLGRPNREQIVSTRPEDLTTLSAMDLNNGNILDSRLAEGAQTLLRRNFDNPTELVNYLWRAALTREPSPQELELILSYIGENPELNQVQDLLWSVLMMPEFQIIR